MANTGTEYVFLKHSWSIWDLGLHTANFQNGTRVCIFQTSMVNTGSGSLYSNQSIEEIGLYSPTISGKFRSWLCILKKITFFSGNRVCIFQQFMSRPWLMDDVTWPGVALSHRMLLSRIYLNEFVSLANLIPYAYMHHCRIVTFSAQNSFELITYQMYRMLTYLHSV